VKIHLVEPNEKSSFETYYGKEIADLVLNLHVEKGVNIYENARIKHFTADSLQFKDNLNIPSDTVLLFPNINVPNTVTIHLNIFRNLQKYRNMVLNLIIMDVLRLILIKEQKSKEYLQQEVVVLPSISLMAHHIKENNGQLHFIKDRLLLIMFWL